MVLYIEDNTKRSVTAVTSPVTPLAARGGNPGPCGQVTPAIGRKRPFRIWRPEGAPPNSKIG